MSAAAGVSALHGEGGAIGLLVSAALPSNEREQDEACRLMKIKASSTMLGIDTLASSQWVSRRDSAKAIASQFTIARLYASPIAGRRA